MTGSVAAAESTERAPTASRTLRIGTRGSALALVQARLVADALGAAGTSTELVIVETAGDRRAPDTAWGEGAFVTAIERELLSGRVDVAVHSAKDVPTDEDRRLAIAAYLPREDPRDALVLRVGTTVTGLESLPPGSVVGTDSPRRAAFIRHRCPDVDVRPIHGNVDTRLRRLDAGDADALVLAVAGLVRLGRHDRVTVPLEADVLPPAPGQGAIAVQVRADDAVALAAVAAIDDGRTRIAVEAERAFLRACGGGCRSPIGALAIVATDHVRIVAGVASEDGRAVAMEDADVPFADPVPVSGSPRGVDRDARGVDRQALRALASRLLARADRDIRDVAVARLRRGAIAIVTRPDDDAGALVTALGARGFTPVVVPAIGIEPIVPSPDDTPVVDLPARDWAVVTSANAVRAIEPALRHAGVEAGDIRWAAVGVATAAAVRAIGGEVGWRPSRATAAALGDELPLDDTRARVDATTVANGRPLVDSPAATVTVIRGVAAGDVLAARLRARGADVRELVVYRTIEGPAASRDRLVRALAARPSVTVLASGSAARGLLSLADVERDELLRIPVVCVGASTAAEAQALGYVVAATASTPDPDALADAALTALGDASDSLPASAIQELAR